MRFVIEKTTLLGVPLFRLQPEDRPDGPLLVLQHGLRGTKESVLNIGLTLAEGGYTVLLPDARMHGERSAPDFEERMKDDFERTLLEVMLGTADDLIALLEHFPNRPIGMVGISMGGFITYLTLTRCRCVQAAVPLISSPDIWSPAALSPEEAVFLESVNPAQHPERFPPCALQIHHGEWDDIVPIGPERAFITQLRPYYQETPERLEFISYPAVGHEVTQEMVRSALAWMEHFLPAHGAVSAAHGAVSAGESEGAGDAGA